MITLRMFTRLVVMMFFVGVTALWCSTARSHSWYPVNCCSDKDCEEVPAPTESGGGYVLSDGRHVPYGEVKMSPDGKWHLCEQKWPIQTSRRKILCVFGPIGGF